MRDKTIPHSTQTQAAELWEQVWPLPASAQNRAGAVAASVSAAQGKDGTQIARTKRWTADEAQRFGELMVRSRKDVARVAKELGGGRTIGDCLGFYYGRWKMTDAYRALKDQMRRDRKAGMINVGVSSAATRSASYARGELGPPRRRSAGGPRASARRRGGVMPPAYTTKPLTGMPAPPPLPKEQLELRREVSEDPENQWQNPLRGLRPPPNDILRAATSLRGGVCTYHGHDWYVCTGGDTLESVAGELELAADVLCCVNEAARRAGALKNGAEVTPSNSVDLEKPILRGFRPEAGAPILLPTATQVKPPPLHNRTGREGSVVDFEERRWYVCRDGETCATVARSLSGAYRFDVSIREDDDARLAAQAAQNALDYLRSQSGEAPVTRQVPEPEPQPEPELPDDRLTERAARLVAEAMAVPSLVSVRKDTKLPARTCLPLPEDMINSRSGWPGHAIRVAPPLVEAEADRAALRNGDVLVEEASGRRWAAAKRGESQQQAARRFGVDARRVAKENDLTPWGAALRRGAVPEGAPLLIPEPGAAARDRDESPRPHTVRRSPAARSTQVTSPSRPAPLACSACRLLGGSASRCRRELRHSAPPYSLPPDVGTRVRVRWLPEGSDENGHHKRASWYFATATVVGEETAEGTRKVVVAYDDGGGDDEIEWPDADAISLPKDQTNLARAAAVSEDQKKIKGQAFKLQGDSRDYRVNDVFYSVEEGIDGVVVQYYDTGVYKEPPSDKDSHAFEWAAFDDFEQRATVESDASQFGRGARRARSPRASLEGRSDSPPRKKRR
jgi:hypothetical protein